MWRPRISAPRGHQVATHAEVHQHIVPAVELEQQILADPAHVDDAPPVGRAPQGGQWLRPCQSQGLAARSYPGDRHAA
jgi:hypothetical protein